MNLFINSSINSQICCIHYAPTPAELQEALKKINLNLPILKKIINSDDSLLLPWLDKDILDDDSTNGELTKYKQNNKQDALSTAGIIKDNNSHDNNSHDKEYKVVKDEQDTDEYDISDLLDNSYISPCNLTPPSSYQSLFQDMPTWDLESFDTLSNIINVISKSAINDCLQDNLIEYWNYYVDYRYHLWIPDNYALESSILVYPFLKNGYFRKLVQSITFWGFTSGSRPRIIESLYSSSEINSDLYLFSDSDSESNYPTYYTVSAPFELKNVTSKNVYSFLSGILRDIIISRLTPPIEYQVHSYLIRELIEIMDSSVMIISTAFSLTMELMRITNVKITNSGLLNSMDLLSDMPALINLAEQVDLERFPLEVKRGCLLAMGTKRTLYFKILAALAYYMKKPPDGVPYLRWNYPYSNVYVQNWIEYNCRFTNEAELRKFVENPMMQLLYTLNIFRRERNTF